MQSASSVPSRNSFIKAPRASSAISRLAKTLRVCLTKTATPETVWLASVPFSAVVSVRAEIPFAAEAEICTSVVITKAPAGSDGGASGGGAGAGVGASSSREWVYRLSARTSHAAYLDALCDSLFVLAPHGNGLDTHRFWEAL